MSVPNTVAPILAGVVAFLSGTVTHATPTNPLFDGADPHAVVVGDRIWIYPTWSEDRRGERFYAFSTETFNEWERHGPVLDFKDVSWIKDDGRERHGAWAPAVLEKNGKWVFYYSVGPQNPTPSRIGVAVGDSPAGPFRDVGKPLLTGGDGFEAIDPMAFSDPESGTTYLYVGGSAGAKLRVFELNPDLVSFAREVPADTPPAFTEAPFMHHRDGRYYLSYSHGGWRDASYSVHYAMSDSPIGPWDYQGAILTSDATRKGPGHHSFIHDPRTGAFVILYHRWENQTGDGPYRGKRRICVDRVEYETNGRIQPIVMTPARGESTASREELARSIREDSTLPDVLDKAKTLLTTGLTAGGGYGEVWIRDLNTFIELALEVNDPEPLREGLLTFFKFQGVDGNIVDGYIPKARAHAGYDYRHSPLASGLLAHKNTVETDQESSLVQAVARYVRITGDNEFLRERIDGLPVIGRLTQALDYVLTERFDPAHGLVWGGTTADWGDVQPEHDWGVELDADSHRAIDIYDNAMLVIAIEDLLSLLEDAAQAERWIQIRDDLKRSIRTHLWDVERGRFVAHLYLDGSPFPVDFDESAVYFHGGTAVAIEAGLLSHEEVKRSLEQMRANVEAAGAGSIGLTLYPPYPAGSFKNKAMAPYHYQNGGDWCWFGGRMIRQLLAYGLVEDAYLEIQPMLSRVLASGDFFEWWSLENQARGSNQFRGSAGVLGITIQELLAWAQQLDEVP